jgi:glycosyltransferase involved in cell wall biosynthesis
MTKPLVSVVVTAYNVEPYIEQCLNSVISQSYKDLEIVVVDDCSLDGTTDVVRRIAKQDTRIRLIVHPARTPGGVGSSANTGINSATGDYLLFLDGDDWAEPEMVENLLAVALEDNSDIVVASYLEFDEEKKVTKKPAAMGLWFELLTHDRVRDYEALRRVMLLMVPVPWRKIYRLKFLTENRIEFPVVDYFYEDNPFHWQTTLLAERPRVLYDIVCHHRVARSGQTMGSSGRELFAFSLYHKLIREFMMQRGLYASYSAELTQWLVAQCLWSTIKIKPEFHDEYFSVMSRGLRSHGFRDLVRLFLLKRSGRRSRRSMAFALLCGFASWSRKRARSQKMLQRVN